MKKMQKSLVIIIAVILFAAVIAFALWNNSIAKSGQAVSVPKTGELISDIKNGASIMWLGPHMDDEMNILGTIAYACGEMKNNCYALAVYSAEKDNMEQNRYPAIEWINKTYLKDYFVLGISTNLAYNTKLTLLNQAEEKIKEKIESIKPDILITFSPIGYYNHEQHEVFSRIVNDLYPKLSYKPKLYWVINPDKGYFYYHHEKKKYYEYTVYPPTDFIDGSRYLSKLKKTVAAANYEADKEYAKYISIFQDIITDKKVLQAYDGEYFFKVDTAFPKSGCKDTDKGVDYTKQGTVLTSSGAFGTDFCYTLVNQSTLNEYYCSGDKPNSSKYECASEGKVCSGGMCVVLSASLNPSVKR